jgi:hypothetical protein
MAQADLSRGELGRAGLALGVLTLGLFAPISPFNGAAFDEWSYLRAGQLGAWHAPAISRDYAFGLNVLAHQAWGERSQGTLWAVMLCFWAISLIFYALVRRWTALPPLLALLGAALYLSYIPVNTEQVRPFYTAQYPWSLILAAGAALLLGEAYQRRRPLVWLIPALGLGYVAISSHEGLLFLLSLLPWLYGGSRVYAGYLPWKRALGLTLWWYAALLFGLRHFLLNFFGDSGNTVGGGAENLGGPSLPEQAARFYELAFPVGRYLPAWNDPQAATLGLALLAGLALWMMARRAESPPPPSRRQLLALGALGLLLTGLGGLGFMVAGTVDAPRAQFFAAPGQALALMAGLGLLAHFLERALAWRPAYSLYAAGMLAVYLGGGWYMQAQAWALTRHSPPDHAEKNAFFREVLALAPEVLPGTLLYYDCQAPYQIAQWGRVADVWAVRYLYAGEAEIMNRRWDYLPTPPPQVLWTAGGVEVEAMREVSERENRRLFFAYEQIVVLQCRPEGLAIADRFPPDLAPPGANTGAYNPYARLGGGYIREEAARVTAR